ncbi:MAG: exonuclease domain-containing protein [Candidatus Dormibacteria bacterium]
MQSKDWVILDTETTGFTAPIIVVEIAAQRMRGWDTNGAPFRRLLNLNADIPPEASRVHGYTREILERDGEPAIDVYRDFAAYTGDLPIVSYNLKYDLEVVLKPEWSRLGIKPIGSQGFCALRLAQRLLDPVPAGNCKLQTLRQFYRLPERGAHTAMGDVETVIDLLSEVLQPIAQDRELAAWNDICAFTEEDWFPSRIAFGKFKGRDFRDATDDEQLKSWLLWLSESSNQRSAIMGKWYLSQLVAPTRAEKIRSTEHVFDRANVQTEKEAVRPSLGSDVTLYRNLEVERLQVLIASARSRLAELGSAYTKDKRAVDYIQAQIFKLVREQYQARDRIKLIVEYRRKFLDALMAEGDEQAEQVANEYKEARAESDTNYDKASAAAASQRILSEEDRAALTLLWRKLVKLYHPDRFASEPEKKAAFEKLTAAINQARDEGDIELLREIADDPEGFMLRQGWGALDLTEEVEIKALHKLYASLQLEIVNLLDMLNRLHESPEHELLTLSQTTPQLIEEVAAQQWKAISDEIAALNEEAARLQREIDELSGAGDRINL